MTEQEYINTKALGTITAAINTLKDLCAENLKDTIKDAKDVGKVFTPYSDAFKLPASASNNRIFKHFHNPNVLNGFDGRRKHSAVIKLNGNDFKKGYIKLIGVDLVDNSPDSYRVQFFGELTSLKDTLGDKKLSDLVSLNRYRYDNTIANVQAGFEDSFDVVQLPPSSGGGTQVQVNAENRGMFKYPFI